MLLLVHPTPQARLRSLCMALLEVDPGLRVAARASEVADMAAGSLVLLGVTADDAVWLNHNRPLFSRRGLRVVLWPAPDLGGAAGLRAAAPDFFDWISDVVPLPAGPPAFAVAGLRAGLGWRPGLAWGGGDLDGALAAASVTGARRISALQPYGAMLGALEDPAPVVWTDVHDPRELWRVQWALAERRWTGVSVLEAPRVPTPRWWPVHGEVQSWWTTTDQLAGAQEPALLAALLDGEPELVELLRAKIAAGESTDAWITQLTAAPDPGVWSLEVGGGPPRLRAPAEEAPATLANRWAAEVEAGLRQDAPDWSALVGGAFQLGELDVARRWVEAALARTAEETAEEVVLRRWYGVVLRSQAELSAARAQLERALEVTVRLSGTEEHPEVAASLHELGRVSLAIGDLDRARACLERSMSLQIQRFGTEEVSSIAASLHDLGAVLHAQGDLDGASLRLKRSLDIKRRVFGTELHPEVAASLHALAGVYQAQGDLDAAEASLERALAIKAQVYGTEVHPSYAVSLGVLATVLQAKGDLEGARALLEDALAIELEIFPEAAHPDVAGVVHGLASLMKAQGDLPGARRAYERALEIDHKLYGAEDNYNASVTELNLAQVLLAQGERAQATALLEHALDVFQRTLPPDHPLAHQVATLLAAAR